MSVEAQKPVVAAGEPVDAPVTKDISSAPAPVETSAPVTESKPVESTEAPVTTESSAPATTEEVAPVKEAPAPIEEGILGYKGVGLLK